MDFRGESVAGLAMRVRAGELTARALVEHSLDRIAELDGRLNAFVAVDAHAALRAAENVDRQVAAGEDPGPLAGIPLAVKDLEDAAGFVTTHGSSVHAGDLPATRDATLVARLKDSGCVVVGKTNTAEFGWRPDTLNPTFGATRNPWDVERSPGGSSGGSAVALAAGMVPLATGTDGGGSIRIPAALCGLSAMKPSMGRIPAAGRRPPDWPLLGTSGPMACTIRDTAHALDAVLGPDPDDLRSLPMPEASWRRSLENLHAPRRVGWAPTLGYAPVDSEVRQVCEAAVNRLETLGVEVVEVDPVFDEDPIVAWLTLAGVYVLRSLESVRAGAGWESVDPGLRTIVDWAASSISAVDVIRAEDACHHLNHRLVEELADVSVILTPTVAGATPLSGEAGTVDGVSDENWVRFTYPFNLTRSPAGTVCAGFSATGMPVGLQVVGPPHGDVAVLRCLAVLEDMLALDRRPPE